MREPVIQLYIVSKKSPIAISRACQMEGEDQQPLEGLCIPYLKSYVNYFRTTAIFEKTGDLTVLNIMDTCLHNTAFGNNVTAFFKKQRLTKSQKNQISAVLAEYVFFWRPRTGYWDYEVLMLHFHLEFWV